MTGNVLFGLSDSQKKMVPPPTRTYLLIKTASWSCPFYCLNPCTYTILSSKSNIHLMPFPFHSNVPFIEFKKVDRKINYQKRHFFKYFVNMEYFCHINTYHLTVSNTFSKFNHTVYQNTKWLTMTPTSFLKETCCSFTVASLYAIPWASCQIRKLRVAHAPGIPGTCRGAYRDR